MQVTFEGIRKGTVYDDSATGGGRVLRYELFANQTDYDNFMATGTLAAGKLWERVSMTYDAFGRLLTTTHVYANGATPTALNGLIGNPTTTVNTDTWTNTYDVQGRLTQEASPTGAVAYEYDALGRKTKVAAYLRDAGGTLLATTNSEVTYNYDALSRLATVNTIKRDGTALTPESTTYHYDLLGRMDYTEMPNSVVEDYTFDNMDRLDVMRHYQSDANNANLADNVLKDMFDYTYRNDGKRTGLSETFNTLTPLTNNYTWSYDNAGRLTSEFLDSSDNSLDQTESYLMDLVGNRIRRTIDKPGTANDVTDIYTYNTSDQLQTENRYSGIFPTGTPTGSSQQSTVYTWSGTQQASKTVSVPSVSSVFQNMSYGLGGQLERVVTTNTNGSGSVTARTQVEYRYDNTGVRFLAIDSKDSNLATPAIDRVENGRTEYVIDHANMTGYQQTIIETFKNAAGQATKRTSYTFGTDEVTQTVSTLDPATGNVTATETLTFGHDGHGNTRVLFGALAAFVQVFTYSAYGEFLAIHNASGARDATNGGTASSLANPAGAKTSLLYNGEGIDSRTGLYNFRARWYSASSGRFERLDPYAGNPNNPFSFNKYGFVHGNPVMGIDPTGLEFSLGGMMSAMGITGFNLGGKSIGAYSARVGAMSALQTGFEYFITQQIYSWFLPGQTDDTDWERTFDTNFVSNFATGGLQGTVFAKFLVDTLINALSDWTAGKFSWVSLGVRALVFAGSEGLKKAGGKVISSFGNKGAAGGASGIRGVTGLRDAEDFIPGRIQAKDSQTCGLYAVNSAMKHVGAGPLRGISELFRDIMATGRQLYDHELVDLVNGMPGVAGFVKTGWNRDELFSTLTRGSVVAHVDGNHWVHVVSAFSKKGREFVHVYDSGRGGFYTQAMDSFYSRTSASSPLVVIAKIN